MLTGGDDAREAPLAAAPRVVDRTVEVVRVTDLTAWYRRIDFVAEGLLSRLALAPGAYLMVSPPAPAGLRPTQRAYTVVRPVPARAQSELDRFSLEFVLHDPAGPASAWAAQARPGDRIQVSDPPYHFELPQPLAQAWLVADSAAVPALRSILDRLPAAVPAQVVLVDPRPDRELVFDHDRPGASVAWLDRLTAADLADWAVDPDQDWLWAAGQRDLVKTVRALARGPWRLDRSRQHLQTYWI
ncbi:MAG: siderophore-interacting protein [Propionibacteriaceae bacterium]|jgi:ATP-binding cassette subfamily B protein IrtA|nr:siderophore-interacting protein [Propionibacteriaceae bacterium]